MDQLPRRESNGFANNTMFADSQQQYNAYGSLYSSADVDQSSFEDNGWDMNPSTYAQSRAQHVPSPSWPQNANQNPPAPSHLSNSTGQPSPYARSLSHSPAPYGQSGFTGYPAQNFQYQQHQPQYDPALFQQPSHGHGQNLNYSAATYQTINPGTIAPQALENARSPAFNPRHNYGQNYPTNNNPAQRAGSNNIVDQKQLSVSVPAGADAGLFSIINFDQLARSTNSSRMGNFVNIGNEPLNWDCNRAQAPAYVPRKSRNELRRAAGNDANLLARIGEKSAILKRIAAAPKTVQTAAVKAALPSEKIRYEGEVSSDESSSSDDDDSDYTSDEATESAPLPAKRPTDSKAATEYDTIKALWRSRRRGTSSESIRKGLVEFWEAVKNIRDIWKADTAAVEEAKKKGQKGQLNLLNSRVKDQRDMMEVAFKAALKHGHRNIIEVMSQNEPLIYLCYQFLLDRFKNEDFNSPLPRALLEVMTIWTSLTQERLEKTHLTKLLARFAKYGDAKTKYYAQKIESNAAIASKDKAAGAESKKAASITAGPGSPSQRTASATAGVKRAATGTAGEGSAAKKVATGATKPSTAATGTKSEGLLKKASASAAATKSATASTAAAPAVKTKQVVAKPSGIFSSLSAAKKPGTSNASRAGSTTSSTASKLAQKKPVSAPPKPTFSFAETMKNLSKPKEEPPAQQKPEKVLPPETPEEKARRLRKESRRHLRVSFKQADELTEVRYFTHDPDEEFGHDASQVRDVGDVGGEGRMFKQQQQLMDEEDEEEISERDEKSLIAFKEPTTIDFADVDPGERERNYVQHGGKMEVQSEERAVRDYYEANNLIVFYDNANDIPPSPREPADPDNGEPVNNVGEFATPPDQYGARARQRRLVQNKWYGGQQQASMQSAPPQPFDMSKLNGLINAQPAQQPTQAPQQPIDISSILANLSKVTGNQPAPAPQPQMGGFQPNSYQPPPPSMMNGMQPQQQAPQQPQQPQAPIDLASILAQIGAAPPQPAMGAGYGMPAPAMNFGQQNAGQPQFQRTGGAGGPAGDNNMTPESRMNPTSNRWYRTKTCQFWLKGTCQKGDACSYKHSE